MIGLRFRYLLLFLGLPLLIGCAQQDSEIQFTELFAKGEFEQPVAVRHADDGSGRLYVVEKTGKIVELIPKGHRSYERRTFADLTNRVNARGSEQGLLGLAFHPDYDGNGLYYVNYTTENNETVVAERQTNTDRERELLRFVQPYENHNGGDLTFGPDGKLYIASGDGGSAGDPEGYSQNKDSMLGKILRVDVNIRDEAAEVYAYGLRNPWRISFDRETGELWAADVGQNEREEINIIEEGGNYGWNIMEGTYCYKPNSADGTCLQESLIPPVFEYEHGWGGASVTGGYVYRGNEIKHLRGKYLFADFLDGRIWTLAKEANGSFSASLLRDNIEGISSFGEDEQGEIYAVTYAGELLKVEESINKK